MEFFDQSYPFFDRQRSFIFYSKHITYFVTVYVIGTQFQNFSEPDFWLSHSSVLLTEVSKTYYEFYSKANTELYKLNIGFKNVSVSLESKTESIGSAKDRAVDLQQRANALATSASNQLSNLLGINFTNILSATFSNKVFGADFLLLQFGFVIFWQKNISTKASRKMLVAICKEFA